jgi:hypothetical protein
MKDEIIEAVWKAKDRVATRHRHDVKRLVEHLRSEENASGTRAVDLHSRQRPASQSA